MRPLYLCELVLNELTDSTLAFFCVGKPDVDDLQVAGAVAKSRAFGLVASDFYLSYGGLRDAVLADVGNIPEVRYARCPRQILSPASLQEMLIFDVERLRNDDLTPLIAVPGDVN